MKKLLNLLMLCTAFSFTNVNASTRTENEKNTRPIYFNLYVSPTAPTDSKDTKSQEVIEFSPPYRGFKTSKKDRIAYTNTYLNAVTTAGYNSFFDYVENVAYMKLNYETKHHTPSKLTYWKFKNKNPEWKDCLYMDVEYITNMCWDFLTAKRGNQLKFIPYPTEQYWWKLRKIKGNDPGMPIMALDEETVRKYLYKRTDRGELEALLLCSLHPIYAILLFFTVKKCGKRVSRDELWSLVDPVNLIKVSKDYAKFAYYVQ